MKRGNGEGSITKLKGPRRRPYLVRGPAEYDPETGREKRLILGSYRTRAEAERSLMDYSRSPSKLYNISLGELWQMYTDQQQTRNISKSRASAYSAAWLYWQILQDRKARDLRAIDFQAILDKMQQDDLSAPTINSYVVTIRSALDYAVNNDILYKNYAKNIKLPHIQIKKAPYINDIALSKIEQAAREGITPADAVLTMCYTGFRPSEFVQLRTANYDPIAHTLTGGLKTDAGKNRTVPVPAKCLPYVEQWISYGGDYVYTSPDGKPYTYARLRRAFDALCKRLDLDGLSLKATRHTYANKLRKSGADAEVMRALMGHTKYEQSLDYTQADEAEKRAAADRL